MKEIILRNKYLPAFSQFIDNEIIKVIVGQRRVGKSYFTQQLMTYLHECTPETNIIYINMELFEFSTINTAEDLVNYVNKK